jgi:two-component system chemotaxis response regulator CheY
MSKRILSLGQCGADHASLRWLFRSEFNAEVVGVDTPDAALDQLRRGSFDLVLVNRLLDRDRSPGHDFISQLKGDPKLGQLPIMLVSDYDDAQQRAVGQGALRGIGKSSLNDADTLARIRAILEPQG